jgi:hypothetical protein
MSAAGYGAIAGAGLGVATSIIGLSSANKAAIGQIQREGDNLAINMRSINLSREELDRELGDILSKNALETAKNMATAKVLMSTSGTVGGTSSQVSKQSYMDQILADADVITKARSSEKSLLNDAISKRIAFRQSADATRSTIKSPLEAFVGTLSSAIGGAGQGMAVGEQLGKAMPAGGLTTQQLSVKQQAESSLHRTPRANW